MTNLFYHALSILIAIMTIWTTRVLYLTWWKGR